MSIDTEDLLIEEFHQAGIFTERERAEREARLADARRTLGPALDGSLATTLRKLDTEMPTRGCFRPVVATPADQPSDTEYLRLFEGRDGWTR